MKKWAMNKLDSKTIRLCAEAGYAAEEKFLGGSNKWNELSEFDKEWYMISTEYAINKYIEIQQENWSKMNA